MCVIKKKKVTRKFETKSKEDFRKKRLEDTYPPPPPPPPRDPIVGTSLVLHDSRKERQSLPFEINKKWEIEMLGWQGGGEGGREQGSTHCEEGDR